MVTNIEITRKNNESNASVLKRFSRRVQESGIINKVKGGRYAERTPSDYVKKKKKLKVLKKKAETEKAYKLGKIKSGKK